MDPTPSIPIDSLSVADKIVLMERLWEDLSQRPADVGFPNWHGDILEERRTSLREGKTTLVDWSDAKKRLRDRHQ